MIFERQHMDGQSPRIQFSKEYQKRSDSKAFAQFYTKKLKSNELLLKLVNDVEDEGQESVRIAYNWFEKELIVVEPDTRFLTLHALIESDPKFKSYLDDLVKAFHVGINGVTADRQLASDFFGKDNMREYERLIQTIVGKPNKQMILATSDGDQIRFFEEQGEHFVGQIKLRHQDDQEHEREFYPREESDGTRRLLDLSPVFYPSEASTRVYVIDEIERSIHPLMIKELIRKFSQAADTPVQIIFTTHESNLLDQEIFRQDEIWFAEKNPDGCTDMYSLSDFKEHNTIDIQKGYLTGRYGSIPFLGNLRDLNWGRNADIQQI
jgi:hypothetical protein